METIRERVDLLQAIIAQQNSQLEELQQKKLEVEKRFYWTSQQHVSALQRKITHKSDLHEAAKAVGRSLQQGVIN